MAFRGTIPSFASIAFECSSPIVEMYCIVPFINYDLKKDLHFNKRPFNIPIVREISRITGNF
jgi:hypothetical protein